jgi:hypothetical protein
MINSFPYVDSQTEILIWAQCLHCHWKNRSIIAIKEIILRILYTILNAMPISEMFEENTNAPNE